MADAEGCHPSWVIGFPALDFGDRPVLPVEGRLANALRQVWPVEDRAVWPPPLALDEAAMDAISNSYGGDF